MKTSPVLMMKAKKNQVEAKGMMNASLKDSVALCDFLSLMAEEVSIFLLHFVLTIAVYYFGSCD